MILNEMALNRRDAIDRCISLGIQFKEHFNKVLKDTPYSENYIHHCIEMDAFWTQVKRIRIKGSNKFLSSELLIDWFFSAGGSIEDDIDAVDLYDKLISYMLYKRDISVKDAIEILW